MFNFYFFDIMFEKLLFFYADSDFVLVPNAKAMNASFHTCSFTLISTVPGMDEKQEVK